MANYITIKGNGSVIAKLLSRAKKVKPARVNVGYSAPYAIYVHENLEAYHDNGQAKFLERPFREHRRELLKEISTSLRSIVSDASDTDKSLLEQPLEDAGRKLLHLSQELVPVKTGVLRDSGFVDVNGRRVEGDATSSTNPGANSSNTKSTSSSNTKSSRTNKDSRRAK